MYDHRQPLSDEMVAALFQKHLPVEKLPAHVEKRLLSQVLAAVEQLKWIELAAPTHPSELDRNDLPRNPRPHPASEKKYSLYPVPDSQGVSRQSRPLWGQQA